MSQKAAEGERDAAKSERDEAQKGKSAAEELLKTLRSEKAEAEKAKNEAEKAQKAAEADKSAAETAKKEAADAQKAVQADCEKRLKEAGALIQKERDIVHGAGDTMLSTNVYSMLNRIGGGLLSSRTTRALRLRIVRRRSKK